MAVARRMMGLIPGRNKIFCTLISEGTKSLKLVISAVSTRAIVSTVMEQDIILDITNLESSDSYVTED